MKGYELSEDAVRILAEIVRAYKAGKLGRQAAPPRSARRDAPYTPAFYRLATNDGAGAYTLRKQEWDADAEEMIDLVDEFDPDFELDIDGYDFRGRADGVAGAAGTGQIVRGWTVWDVDDWITLVDVATKGGVFPVDLAQVGGTDGNATTTASWTYDATDPMAPDDADPLAEAVNPTSSPHKWRRPTGVMTKATFGHAHFDKTGALVIGWINEVAVQEACP